MMIVYHKKPENISRHSCEPFKFIAEQLDLRIISSCDITIIVTLERILPWKITLTISD